MYRFQAFAKSLLLSGLTALEIVRLAETSGLTSEQILLGAPISRRTYMHLAHYAISAMEPETVAALAFRSITGADHKAYTSRMLEAPVNSGAKSEPRSTTKPGRPSVDDSVMPDCQPGAHVQTPPKVLGGMEPLLRKTQMGHPAQASTPTTGVKKAKQPEGLGVVEKSRKYEAYSRNVESSGSAASLYPIDVSNILMFQPPTTIKETAVRAEISEKVTYMREIDRLEAEGFQLVTRRKSPTRKLTPKEDVIKLVYSKEYRDNHAQQAATLTWVKPKTEDDWYHESLIMLARRTGKPAAAQKALVAKWKTEGYSPG